MGILINPIKSTVGRVFTETARFGRIKRVGEKDLKLRAIDIYQGEGRIYKWLEILEKRIKQGNTQRIRNTENDILKYIQKEVEEMGFIFRDTLWISAGIIEHLRGLFSKDELLKRKGFSSDYAQELEQKIIKELRIFSLKLDAAGDMLKGEAQKAKSV